jgi:HK97 family phage major capsid protein
VKADELRVQRNKAVDFGRSILELSEKENRANTAEEIAQWKKSHDEAKDLGERIERMERQERAELELRASQGNISSQINSDPVTVSVNGDDYESRLSAEQAKRSKAFHRFITGGTTATYKAGAIEARALQMDSDPAGGYTVRGEQFVEQLIQAVDDLLWIRGMATTYTVTNAESLGVPSLDTDPADADWTSELATGGEDTAMAFGKRELTPRPLAKRIKISKKLMQASALPIENIVRTRLAYKFAVTQEKAFLTGSGVNQPLGLFTASADGIPTTRDVSTGNTGTSLTFDGLISAKYALKANYWPRAAWLFHSDGMEQIAKLKDGNGQYIWQPTVTAGQPDRILNFPVRVSEFSPNTFTTGQYVGMLADYSHYWIADALSLELQMLVELYAETNQVGFIGRLETDGMPVLAEAFVRVTMG